MATAKNTGESEIDPAKRLVALSTQVAEIVKEKEESVKALQGDVAELKQEVAKLEQRLQNEKAKTKQLKEKLRSWDRRQCAGLQISHQTTTSAVQSRHKKDEASLELEVGARVHVFWKKDDAFFPGTIKLQTKELEYEVSYDDGDEGTINIRDDKIFLVDEHALIVREVRTEQENAAAGCKKRSLDAAVKTEDDYRTELESSSHRSSKARRISQPQHADKEESTVTECAGAKAEDDTVRISNTSQQTSMIRDPEISKLGAGSTIRPARSARVSKEREGCSSASVAATTAVAVKEEEQYLNETNAVEEGKNSRESRKVNRTHFGLENESAIKYDEETVLLTEPELSPKLRQLVDKLQLPVSAFGTGLAGTNQLNPSHLPRRFEDVLLLMDFLHDPSPENGSTFHRRLYIEADHKSRQRPGIETRKKLRKEKEKNPTNPAVSWHRKGREWAPPDLDHLKAFIRFLKSLDL